MAGNIAGVDTGLVEFATTVISALLGLVTTAVALLVYTEAKKYIRRVEWFSKAAANWQNFNALVVSSGYAERWGAIIAGKVDWPDLNQKDLMIIYSFLNVLVFEFNAQRKRLLDWDYAQKSVIQNVGNLRHVWPDLSAHLERDGWPDEFLALANAIVAGRVNPGI